MNPYRLVGAALILGASAWTGFHGAWTLRRTERQLRELASALQTMECEIACANARFPALCRRLSEGRDDAVGVYFRTLAEKAPGEGASREAARRAGLSLPEPVSRSMEDLIDGFGGYDLDSQLKQVRRARDTVDAERKEAREGLESGCRTWELLGVCTGAAVLILVI